MKLLYLSLIILLVNSQNNNDFLTLFDNFDSSEETCSAYDTLSSGSCSQNCGQCFNKNGPDGVMCPDQKSTGYYCPDQNNFACLDWTFGSKNMQKAEQEFSQQNNDNVYFGVGSYGSSEDKMRGIGNCYRMKIKGVDKDLILQSINTGSDVQGNQFDLMMGDGGAGAFNWCAGDSFSLYPGDYSAWGNIYGGWSTRDKCANLPPYPQNKNSKYDYDNLIELCQYSFDKNVRGQNGENPTILDLARVQCPKELYQFTAIKRSDDPVGYKFENGKRPAGFPNSAVTCGSTPQSLSFCLTRMMDCRKPSGGFKDNIVEESVVDGLKLVQICTNDGYSRIDNKCGCYGCYC